MLIRDTDYGTCSRCGGKLVPVWFTEEEYKVTPEGYKYKTGRQRLACSHLECIDCLKNECVDDSFDGPWH